ncbi:JAB domain-containing protein [Serratia fonticola]|uniref:JAB domain-containing protein n=1 Tax=Serratia fonticola TaxID=47917 RepID=UPI0028F7231A|nr:JAB domain-containing protein [Serratia fonticola]
MHTRIPLFRGTLNTISIHPREVIKCVHQNNATAVILAHNYPGGEPESRQNLWLRDKWCDAESYLI